jgi:hypothetical protein
MSTSSSTEPDINYLSLTDEQAKSGMLNELDLSHVRGQNYSDVLKISHKQGIPIRGVGMVIPRGRENALDIEDCDDVILNGEFGTNSVDGAKGTAITAKGNLSNAHLSGLIRGPAGQQNAHIDVGNWYDQNYGWSKNIVLNFHHESVGPVYVVTGWVKPFSIKLQGGCKWLMWQSLALKAYVLAKFVVRFLMRIPKGVKGPAWM